MTRVQGGGGRASGAGGAWGLPSANPFTANVVERDPKAQRARVLLDEAHRLELAPRPMIFDRPALHFVEVQRATGVGALFGREKTVRISWHDALDKVKAGRPVLAQTVTAERPPDNLLDWTPRATAHGAPVGLASVDDMVRWLEKAGLPFLRGPGR